MRSKALSIRSTRRTLASSQRPNRKAQLRSDRAEQSMPAPDCSAAISELLRKTTSRKNNDSVVNAYTAERDAKIAALMGNANARADAQIETEKKPGAHQFQRLSRLSSEVAAGCQDRCRELCEKRT